MLTTHTHFLLILHLILIKSSSKQGIHEILGSDQTCHSKIHFLNSKCILKSACELTAKYLKSDFLFANIKRYSFKFCCIIVMTSSRLLSYIEFQPQVAKICDYTHE